MKLVRSWPAVIPEGRSYVVDDIERFVMGGDAGRPYDYRGLLDLNDDIVLIEWDIAVGAEQLALFMARAKENPDQIRVAPYLLYRSGRDGRRPVRAPVPFYVHRIRTEQRRCWATREDMTCQMFGFGLAYLPRWSLEAFVAQMPPDSHFGDSEFSRWHMRNAPVQFRNVPIDWDCHAVHLHCKTPEVP